MAFEESISDFIDVDEFADEALIDNECVNGIFDRVYVNVGEVDSLKPTFYCALSDVVDLVQGGSVVVNDDSFTLADKQPEEPFCLLVLHDA